MSGDQDLKKQLFDAAKSALDNSYSPYSKFKVASAIVTHTGKVFSGVNVENASYGGTICAERVAIFKSISEGHKDIKALAVLTDTPEPWPPCGFCRQVMVEFADMSMPVYCFNLKGQVKEFELKDLCPEFFSPKNLNL